MGGPAAEMFNLVSSVISVLNLVVVIIALGLPMILYKDESAQIGLWRYCVYTDGDWSCYWYTDDDTSMATVFGSGVPMYLKPARALYAFALCLHFLGTICCFLGCLPVSRLSFGDRHSLLGSAMFHIAAACMYFCVAMYMACKPWIRDFTKSPYDMSYSYTFAAAWIALFLAFVSAFLSYWETHAHGDSQALQYGHDTTKPEASTATTAKQDASLEESQH